MTNVLLTGASGKLGKQLSLLFPTQTTSTPTSGEMNLTSEGQVNRYIFHKRPEVVIHLAAMTAPPRCEVNKKACYEVNVKGTQNLVKAIRAHVPNAYLVLMSTPCVFSGDDETPKDEDYIQYPDNYYGISKMLQEDAVRYSGLKTLIIRGNFVPYEKWPHPKAFSDRFSNYLFAHQLARAMMEVIVTGYEGQVHLIGDRVMSMLELARMCPDSKKVKAMTYSEYYKENPHAVKLTKNMVLNTLLWKKYSIEG